MQSKSDKYRLLLENLPDAFAYHQIVTDDAGTLVDCICLEVNSAFEAMIGFAREKIVGKRLSELQPDIIKPSSDWITSCAKVALSGKSINFEHYSDHADRWYDVTAYSDEPGCLATVLRDITDKKQSRKALIHSEMLLKKAQEIGRLGSWELDLKSNRLFWSDEAYRIFGLKPQEFEATYEAFLGVVHPDDRAAVDAAYTESIKNNMDAYEIEHCIVHERSGDIRYVYEKCEHIRDCSGAVVRSMGMVHDITERKLAQEALQQQNLQMRTIFDTVPNYIFAKDIDGRFLLANKAMADLFGVDPEEMDGKTELDFGSTPEQIAKHHRDDRGVIESGKPLFTPEEKVVKRDGSIGWFQTLKIPYQHPGWPKRAMLGIATDIIEHKRAKEELQASEARFRAIIESARDAIFVADVDDMVIVHANENASKFTGYTTDELVGKSVLDLHPPGNTVNVINGFHENRTLQGQGRHENIIVHKDGRTTPVEISTGTPFAMGDRTVVVGFFRDMSERMRAQDAQRRATERLQERDEYLKTILQTTVDGFWVIDVATGKILDANEAYCRMSGYTYDEPLELHIADVDVSDSPQEIDARIGRIIKNGAELFETRHRRKNGNVYDVEVSVSFLSGNSCKLICFCRDISERKLAEQALRESEEKFRAISDSALDAIIMIDDIGRVVYWSPSAEATFGYSGLEVMGKDVHQYLLPEQYRTRLKQGYAEFRHTGAGDAVGRVLELTGKHSSGAEFPIELALSRIKVKGSFWSSAVIRDITERKKADERLRHLSFHDQLTGLYNRHYLEEEMQRLDTERQLPISIIMADLNGLKLVNDTYGHETGDEMLRRTAAILKGICRQEDIIARWGGDEFVIYLPQTPNEEAQAIGRRIDRAYREVAVESVPVTVSYGIAVKETAERDLAVVLKEAEIGRASCRERV